MIWIIIDWNSLHCAPKLPAGKGFNNACKKMDNACQSPVWNPLIFSAAFYLECNYA